MFGYWNDPDEEEMYYEEYRKRMERHFHGDPMARDYEDIVVEDSFAEMENPYAGVEVA